MLERLYAKLDRLEEIANWINDNDREWWPFLFLRPLEHERLGSRRVLLLATLYGFFAGMLANVLVVLTRAPAISVWTFPLWTTLIFFTVYRGTFAYFWNRRAERLLHSRAGRGRAMQRP
jgi:hypothetical protein